MPNDDTNIPSLLLGIDGGGTKCKVRLEDSNGSLLAEATSGPANIATSITQAQESIIDAATCALMYADLPLSLIGSLHTYAGLAGANVQTAAMAMRQWQHPFARLCVTTDMHIACAGAHAKAKGAVIIIGTGFCAGALDSNEHIELGGHGLLLSDGASGAWLGLGLVRHTLEVLDGLASSSSATDALLAYTQCHNSAELTALCLDAKPAFFAQFAPLIFNHCNTDIGSLLITRATDYVSRYITHLQHLGYSRVCLMGGVADALTPWLDEHTKHTLVAASSPPEKGAIDLMRQQP